MSIKIDNALNLVVPVNERAFAYHTPITSAIFEQSFRVIAATRADLMAPGPTYQVSSGPKIALLTLRAKGGELAGGAYAAQTKSLIAELERLTTVFGYAPDGVDPQPVDAALRDGVISDDEWNDTLSRLVFFTCHYAMAWTAEKRSIAEAVSPLLRASLTSSGVTELRASSPTLTPPSHSQETAS